MLRVVSLLAAAVCGVASVRISAELSEFLAREHFEVFVGKYGKEYASPEERESRFWTFLGNLEAAVAANEALAAQGLDRVHGVTKFSDWTRKEYEQMVGGFRGEDGPSKAPVATPRVATAPAAVDWRTSGAVTPVKDQGKCGSCWAHSAIETLESARALAGFGLEPLSVQQLVSCDDVDQGCDGGWYYTAWEDYVATHGVASEAAYPYDWRTSKGRATPCELVDATEATTVAGFSWATTPCTGLFCSNQDEDTLKKNLASYGPLSIACDASEWSSYAGGVLTPESCASSDLKLDHAVQLVGYNTTAPTPYWIVRNSWNTDWGLDGYIHLKMGDNTCGIADKPALVTLAQDAASTF